MVYFSLAVTKQLQLLNVDITRETLVKIESGKQHIKLEQLKGIKKTLDTEFHYLFKKIIRLLKRSSLSDVHK